MCGGHTLIHILYALRLIDSATRREVDLHVRDRLQCHPHLQVLCGVGGGGSSHTVISQQPSTVVALVDEVVARKSEGKAQSRCHRPTRVALTEGIACIRDESRERHTKLVAIGETYTAHHHEEISHRLRRLIPPLGVDSRFGCHTQHHLHRVHVLYENLVVIYHLVFQRIVMPVLCFCLDDNTLRLLAVVHGKCGVGLEG